MATQEGACASAQAPTRPLVSREAARELGLKTFFTGIPCKGGHVAERYVKGDAMCVECRKERDARNAVQNAAWRAKNAERLKASNKARHLNSTLAV
jgi:hypothetical protein